VPILNNASLTGDRFFTFRLQRQTPGVLGSPASALVTITDAQQDPNVRFELSSYNVPRTIGIAAIAVMLSAPSAFTATVMYTMSDGTALAGVDYTPSSGTLTFAPGETNRLIEVPILESGPDVGDRIFTLGLSNPTRATLGDNYRATVLIRATNALRVQLPVVLGTYDIYGENEPNGAIATANGPIESGLTYHGVYDVNQVDQFGLDRDTWMFNVAVPGPVTVVVTGDDPGHQVRLLNASGVDIPGGFSGDPGSMASFSVNVTAAGNYYVRVINSAQLGSAEYQLQVTFP
jgi:hypothetical protein